MQERRDFLKKSAKITGAFMGLGLLFNTKTFAKENSNPILDNTQNFIMSAKNGERIPTKAYAAHSKEWKFKPFSFTRHALGQNDILIEILYAGICHSDLHSVSGDHHGTTYPIVPGHEIVGRVVAVGQKVSKFKIGDYAGVGCMVNSCGECDACKRSEEQFCERGKSIFTYNSVDYFHGNENTYGGYSNNIVVSENFGIKVAKDADISKIAPLLCAGITTYSPIKFSKVKKGDKVAVAGLGGLGHMALKYMIALGAEVTCFDIVPSKKKTVLKLGAKRFIDVNSDDFKKIKNEFDFIISTIPYEYDINAYHKMLKLNGEMAIVGLPVKANINGADMIWNFRKKIYSSLIGGIKETQEMLDYSIKNNIYPEVEIIPITRLDEAYQNVAKGRVEFRYVIDMSTLS